jgi:serine/threonine protein kinase
MNQGNAADNLLGRTLTSGWKVIEKIQRCDDVTGGFYSIGYRVTKNDEICFLKALEFIKYYEKNPGKRVSKIIAIMQSASKYEKVLSDYCRSENVSKLIHVKEAGEENIAGYVVSTVPYLIFDLADGDARMVLRSPDKYSFAWRLKSLRDITIGLEQLHSIEISHQDLKPSNILILNGESRIGDLGRSVCRNISGPFDKEPFTGDFIYAPPEILYRFYMKDWNQRVFATDNYLLGSMVVFYIKGIGMNEMMNKYLHEEFQWRKWKGSFDEVKFHLLRAFNSALDEFENSISEEYFKKELRWIVEKLCHPFPEERGSLHNISFKNNPYNLEIFASRFDLLYKKALNAFKLVG